MSKPNIVYILADDMGYGDLSCLNEHSKIQTAELDRIASGGMAFRDAHASSAVCTPSRYNILTGRYNWRSSLKSGVLGGFSPHLIEPGRMTAASFLRDNGYETACFGKWHLGMDWSVEPGKVLSPDDPAITSWGENTTPNIDYTMPLANGPNGVGFDYFFGISASLDMPPYVYIENDRVTDPPDHNCETVSGKRFYRGGPIASGFRHEQVLLDLTERVCCYIQNRAETEKPFFLYFPLSAPHTPIFPEQFAGVSGVGEYGDFCLLVDWCVGRVRHALEEAGQQDNTILIFTSDNGASPAAGLEELKQAGHQSSYVFRGAKADIYEGGHRIPLLVHWPGAIRPGTICDQTVCLGDLLATVADLLGKQLPETAGEDSVSNLPLWRGEKPDESLREATVHHSVNGSFSIRRGNWKLELCPGSGGWSFPRPGTPEIEGLPPMQLYDLETDVGERKNVIDQHPQLVSELIDLLASYVRQGRSTPGSPQENTGPARWPQLNWMM